MEVQDPLRAGIDVPEPRIIKKVEFEYPNLIKHWFLGNDPVVLDILINEQGLVADIEERSYDASVLESVKAAVRQWIFAPTIVNGRAVPVTATVVAVFSLRYNPHPIDLGVRESYLKLSPGNLCVFPATLTRNGQLKEEQDLRSITMWDAVSGEVRSMSQKEACREQTVSQYTLIPEPDVPFSVIESKMQSPGPHTLYRLASPRYRYFFPENHSTIEHYKSGINRLYYSTLLTSNGSQLIQLAGVDPDVQAPEFALDFNGLAGLLTDSRYKKGLVSKICGYIPAPVSFQAYDKA